MTNPIYNIDRNRSVAVHRFKSAIVQFSKQQGHEDDVTSVTLLDSKRMIYFQVEPEEKEEEDAEEEQEMKVEGAEECEASA